jgi:hypothetical protein
MATPTFQVFSSAGARFKRLFKVIGDREVEDCSKVSSPKKE